MNEKEARKFEHLFEPLKRELSPPTLPELTNRAFGYLECLSQVAPLVDALNEIASWHDGAVVGGHFDEPASAATARKALAQWRDRLRGKNDSVSEANHRPCNNGFLGAVRRTRSNEESTS